MQRESEYVKLVLLTSKRGLKNWAHGASIFLNPRNTPVTKCSNPILPGLGQTHA